MHCQARDRRILIAPLDSLEKAEENTELWFTNKSKECTQHFRRERKVVAKLLLPP